jgi:hypothetical protein
LSLNVLAGGPGNLGLALAGGGRRRAMSTTFDVYPVTMDLPSFVAIIDRSTAELHKFLGSVGIRARPAIHLRIQRCEDDSHVPFSPDAPAYWGKDAYA